MNEQGQTVFESETVFESGSNCIKIPTDGTDDWEIDLRLLKLENEVASGSSGDLYDLIIYFWTLVGL